MRAIVAFVAISGFFFGLNVIAAATMLFFGLIAKSLVEEMPDIIWLWSLIGLAGVAAAVTVGIRMARSINAPLP